MAQAAPDPVEQPAPHLAGMPDRGWWLDEIRLKDFPRIRALLGRSDQLRAAVQAEFCTPEASRVRDRIFATYGETDAVRLNLLMVAAFLFQRKSAAVLDVAREHLTDDEVTLNTGVAGCQNRLALATLLYWKDPELLLAIDLWDRWHSRRRCVLGIEGHRRVSLRLGALTWTRGSSSTARSAPASPTTTCSTTTTSSPARGPRPRSSS